MTEQRMCLLDLADKIILWIIGIDTCKSIHSSIEKLRNVLSDSVVNRYFESLQDEDDEDSS